MILPSSADPRPPSANRGVVTPDKIRTVSVDWLTISVSKAIGSELFYGSNFLKGGGSVQGFRGSELRGVNTGAEAWRRWDPRQPSKLLGDDYESWEASGSNAPWLAHSLQSRHGKEVRPSRVDVAFDLACDESETPELVADQLRPHWEPRPMTDGIYRQGKVSTWYLGKAGAVRRLRVYRKDRQDQRTALDNGPTMRIEIELRKQRAWEFWRVWNLDEEEGLRYASGQVAEITGVALLPDALVVPTVEPPPDTRGAETVVTLIEQWGPIIHACTSLGIDLDALAFERYQSSSKASKSRTAQLRGRLEALGVDEVERIVRGILAGSGVAK